MESNVQTSFSKFQGRSLISNWTSELKILNSKYACEREREREREKKKGREREGREKEREREKRKRAKGGREKEKKKHCIDLQDYTVAKSTLF